MPCRKELVAHERIDNEIAREIGADCVIYQELDKFVECVRGANDKIDGFEISVFTGDYVTG